MKKHNVLAKCCTCPACRRKRIRRVGVLATLAAAVCACTKPAEQPEPVLRSGTLMLG